MKIPFNRPSFQGKELANIAEAIKLGHLSGDGTFTKRCHAILENELLTKKALLTTSCTDALEMCAILLNLQQGDEVILPSFTFVSTANAFVLRGAVPVFVDIRADTLNMDEKLVEAKITSKTKAIILVHYAGVACEMDALLAVSKKFNIPIIEDNAHGLFGKYKGRYLGTFGTFATQSFHETKNFTSGEGGAILINELSHVSRAEIIREKGTDRARFFRGQVDKYTWVDIGSSFLPSDMMAAFLYAQLEAREKIQRRRKEIWDFYATKLLSWATSQNVRLPTVPAECEQSYHMFYLIFPTLEARSAFIDYLKNHDILAVFHYLPLHLSDMGRRFGGKAGDCPVTERVSDTLVRLPFFNDLTTEQQTKVVEAIAHFDARKHVRA